MLAPARVYSGGGHERALHRQPVGDGGGREGGAESTAPQRELRADVVGAPRARPKRDCFKSRCAAMRPAGRQTYLPPPHNQTLSWKLVGVACLFLAGKVCAPL